MRVPNRDTGAPFISSVARYHVEQRISWMRRAIWILLAVNLGQAALLYLCCR